MMSSSFEAIEKSLQPGEKIIWHSSPDPNGVVDYLQKMRVTLLGGVVLVGIFFFGQSALMHIGSHGYWLSAVITALLFGKYFTWEYLMKTMPAWHYALTDIRAISVGPRGKNKHELFWISIVRVTASHDAGWSDLTLIPAPGSGSAMLTLRCVPDALRVHEIADELHSVSQDGFREQVRRQGQ